METGKWKLEIGNRSLRLLSSSFHLFLVPDPENLALVV
jgi:hypothetical protein